MLKQDGASNTLVAAIYCKVKVALGKLRVSEKSF